MRLTLERALNMDPDVAWLRTSLVHRSRCCVSKGAGFRRPSLGSRSYVMHSNLLNVRLLHMAACIGTSLVLRQWMCGHVAVVFGYIFVWRLASWSDAGHGAQCRWCTCAAVGFCCATIVSPRLVPVVFYICGVASLPAKYLRWPPKGTIAGNSMSQLEPV